MTQAIATTTDLTREKIDLIKQTVAKGATDLELDLFLHACKRTGLDPLMKQVYAIKRWNSVDKRDTLTFQTGIDGYRLIADRTGCYAGSSDAEYEVNDEGFPAVARVTVTKLVGGMPCQFSASARWTEYCQKTKDGQVTAMWHKMPFLMLAKCAEALALRKAFPAELSGVYTHEEMMQADVEASPTSKLTAPAKVNELRVEGAVTVPPCGPTSESVASACPPSPDPTDAPDTTGDETPWPVNGKFYGQPMHTLTNSYLNWFLDKYPQADPGLRAQVRTELARREQ